MDMFSTPLGKYLGAYLLDLYGKSIFILVRNGHELTGQFAFPSVLKIYFSTLIPWFLSSQGTYILNVLNSLMNQFYHLDGFLINEVNTSLTGAYFNICIEGHVFHFLKIIL
jgi:hypothetical protein